MLEGSALQLEKILLDLKDALNRLVGSLQEEREAIIEFDLEKVKASYLHKHEILIEIDQLERLRQDWVNRVGGKIIPGGLAKLDSILEVLEKSETERVENIRNQLSCIRSIAQAAQEFNECQRQYLAHSLDHIQSSLMLLDSLQGKGRYQCYNKSGHVLLSNEPRIVLDRNL